MKTRKGYWDFAQRISVVMMMLALVALLPLEAKGQTIVTVAGGGPNNEPALSAGINNVTGVATDKAGNFFIASPNSSQVFKVDATGKLTVLAGTGVFGLSGDNGPATNAQLASPDGVAVDRAGNVFIADTNNSVIREVFGPTPPAGKTTGNIITVAGGGATPGTCTGSTNAIGDGCSATSATLSFPRGVSVDGAGNVFIADTNNRLIREVFGPTPPAGKTTGTITTVAGGGATPGTCTGSTDAIGDGCSATSATLNFPNGVAVDGTGNLFIADTSNSRVRKVNVGGVITTFAGGGATPSTCTGSTDTIGDGCTAINATLSFPDGVAVDGAGNLFIADTSNNRIREVFGPTPPAGKTTGNITTFAGGGATPGTCTGSTDAIGDGCAATNATLSIPIGVALDGTGNLFIADRNDDRIREVFGPTPPTGKTTGNIATVAGNGFRSFGGDNNLAIDAQIRHPFGMAVDAAGNFFIADSDNEVIREVFGPNSTTPVPGTIVTVAGTPGTFSFSGDNGPATGAKFRRPESVAVDSKGNLFIADTQNGRIRKVDTSGVITTFAGGASPSPTPCTPTDAIGDGCSATSATLNFPNGVFVDGSGNVFISDSNHGVIREVVAATGNIITVAGTPNTFNFSGDGGPATSATLSFPAGVFVDAAGNLFISDNGNALIREVFGPTPPKGQTAGNITTVAGTFNVFGFAGDDGPATSAQLCSPDSLLVDNAGNLFIADDCNSNIRVVFGPNPPLGQTAGFIDTVAGSPNTFGFTGDGGSPTAAQLNSPLGLALDSAGNLFIADTFNNRIREVEVSAAGLSSNALAFTAQLAGTESAAQTVTLSNPGKVALAITSIGVTGANSGDFLQSNNCGASVAAGANCTISVKFVPTVSGARSASVTVIDNAGITGNAQQSFSLTGTANADFAIAAASGGSTSATVKAGQTASYALAFTLVGGSSTDQLSVTVTCAGAPAKATCTVPSGAVSVTAATPGTATITVSTTANGMLMPIRFSPPRIPGNRLPVLLLCTLLVLLFWLFGSVQASARGQRNGWASRLALVAPLLVVLVIVAGASGCGGGGSSSTPPAPTPTPTPTPTNNGTPAGTSTLVVTATSGTGASAVTHTQVLTLTVQ